MSHGASGTFRYQKEMKTQPKALEMLFGLVTDLFVDRHKFKGHSVRVVWIAALLGWVRCACVCVQVQHMIPHLMGLLQSYDFDTIVAFFMAPPAPA